MILDLEEEFTVGDEIFFQSISPASSFGVTFEDDSETGYFYAIETKTSLQILDALHIYNVDDVVDQEILSKIQIAWTENGEVASLLINNYCHAIFDFKNNLGYCRNGFPESNGKWSIQEDRTLTDNLIDEVFRSRK